MSATWTFPAFVDLLKTQLEALPAILAFDPVPAVRLFQPALGESLSDMIGLGGEVADDEKIQTALGSHSHDEEVRVSCIAESVRYGSGDVEAVTARNVVNAYLDIIDEHIRTTDFVIGAATLRAPRVEERHYTSYGTTVGENQPARYARILFDITYKARTTP